MMLETVAIKIVWDGVLRGVVAQKLGECGHGFARVVKCRKREYSIFRLPLAGGYRQPENQKQDKMSKKCYLYK